VFQGMIDVDKEMEKLEGKKDTLGKQLKKLQDTAAMPTYTDKVPEDVRSQNQEKVRTKHICIEITFNFIIIMAISTAYGYFYGPKRLQCRRKKENLQT
jgi:hypothetical protein